MVEALEKSDVLIVGAGSAGCVVAERLSREHKRRIHLLDSGPAHLPRGRLLTQLPIGAGATNVRHHREASGLPIVRGSGWGGSSAINGGYFLRWHREDFAAWPQPWSAGRAHFGYTYAEAALKARRVADADLSDAAWAAEKYWRRTYPEIDDDHRWTAVGINRVRVNAVDGRRQDAASKYLRIAQRRQNLTMSFGREVTSLIMDAGGSRTPRVIGVRCSGQDILADEVILCAGTLGTAGILLRTGRLDLTPTPMLPIGEHRERLVRYRRRQEAAPQPLLQTVLHTHSGLEVRCYSDDFARYIEGVEPSGAAIGVAAMVPSGTGRLRLAGDGQVEVTLAQTAEHATAAMAETTGDVIDMLYDEVFDDIVVPGSVVPDTALGTSQHAWGTMPMGERTDAWGGVDGVRGLRIVDGSILPNGGHSGPHATIMMMATVIAEQLCD